MNWEKAAAAAAAYMYALLVWSKSLCTVPPQLLSGMSPDHDLHREEFPARQLEQDHSDMNKQKQTR